MDLLFKGLGTIGLAWALWLHVRSRRVVSNTTLTGAWYWATAACLSWAIVWSVDMLGGVVSPELTDQLWYLTALLLACSGVAVLGARRPTARIWTVFVVLPLLVVLGWPALAVWGGDFRPGAMEIETPTLLGFTLVVVMGTGNYFGTRFTSSSVLTAAAILLAVVPCWSGFNSFSTGPLRMREWATVCYSGAVLLVWRNARWSPADIRPLDRLWFDFRDMFGMVWSKRVLDRINDTLRNQQFPLRLELHGLTWTETEIDTARREDAEALLEKTFRWLLRRFVDPEWIDERCGTPERLETE
jgi:hypothetical protein